MDHAIPSASYLVAETQAFVKRYMSQAQFDSSHDYNHIMRVWALAKHIHSVEKATHPSVNYDPIIIELCALLHDVCDHKYVSALSHSTTSSSITTTNPPSPDHHPPTPAPASFPPITPLEFLLSISCPPSLAHSVQEIITSISYRTETSSPDLIRVTLRDHPELAIVQDADRLDALGAVGIGRAFTFGAARGGGGGGKGQGMQGAVDHFGEKLERLEGMMKTEEGQRMARERTRRVEVFRGWWEEECGVVGGGIK